MWSRKSLTSVDELNYSIRGSDIPEIYLENLCNNGSIGLFV